jgi:ferredoxin-NADP reductase
VLFRSLVEYEKLLNISTQLQRKLRVYIYPVNIQKQHITAAYINEHTEGGLVGKEILLCGPPPMMKSLRGQFKQLGVPGSHIHSEEFSLQ